MDILLLLTTLLFCNDFSVDKSKSELELVWGIDFYTN